MKKAPAEAANPVFKSKKKEQMSSQICKPSVRIRPYHPVEDNAEDQDSWKSKRDLSEGTVGSEERTVSSETRRQAQFQRDDSRGDGEGSRSIELVVGLLVEDGESLHHGRDLGVGVE